MDADIVEFLDTLGEAERAGGRVLHDLEQEAASFRQRADRLQMVTETDVAANLKANAAPRAADDGPRPP